MKKGSGVFFYEIRRGKKTPDPFAENPANPSNLYFFSILID